MGAFRLVDGERARYTQVSGIVGEALPGWRLIEFYLDRPSTYILFLVPAGNPEAGPDRHAGGATVVFPSKAQAEDALGNPVTLRHALWSARAEKAGGDNGVGMAEWEYESKIEDLGKLAAIIERATIEGDTGDAALGAQGQLIALREQAARAYAHLQQRHARVVALVGPEPPSP